MGQSITTGNPFGSEIDLKDLSADTHSRIFTKIWDYELSTPLTGAATYEIVLASARPTLNFNNLYVLKVIEATSNIDFNEFSIFSTSSIGDLYLALPSTTAGNMTPTLFTASSWFMLGGFGVHLTTGRRCLTMLNDAADKIFVRLSGVGNLNTLKLELYEMVIL